MQNNSTQLSKPNSCTPLQYGECEFVAPHSDNLKIVSNIVPVIDTGIDNIPPATEMPSSSSEQTTLSGSLHTPTLDATPTPSAATGSIESLNFCEPREASTSISPKTGHIDKPDVSIVGDKSLKLNAPTDYMTSFSTLPTTGLVSNWFKGAGKAVAKTTHQIASAIGDDLREFATQISADTSTFINSYSNPDRSDHSKQVNDSAHHTDDAPQHDASPNYLYHKKLRGNGPTHLEGITRHFIACYMAMRVDHNSYLNEPGTCDGNNDTFSQITVEELENLKMEYIDWDPILEGVYKDLVPSKLTDYVFWQRFLSRVALLKEKDVTLQTLLLASEDIDEVEDELLWDDVNMHKDATLEVKTDISNKKSAADDDSIL